jgi:hypothetical protein
MKGQRTNQQCFVKTVLSDSMKMEIVFSPILQRLNRPPSVVVSPSVWVCHRLDSGKEKLIGVHSGAY